ncbi:MAG TPA: Sec-independent protein translocase protein TatB [Steroidobacteraceae bacterium]|nr:Sec-independent protein translocase protein TatB [Steroidobacteraceae bacterium]
MFDIGFSEILVIFVLALIVLGPEKLPRVVREVGRWVGRARAMARQFQEQLEEEIDVDRSRTSRPEPVRPVGGVPPASPTPLLPGHTEAPASVEAAQPTTADVPSDAAVAPSEDLPPEPLIPGIHERGT